MGNHNKVISKAVNIVKQSCILGICEEITYTSPLSKLLPNVVKIEDLGVILKFLDEFTLRLINKNYFDVIH